MARNFKKRASTWVLMAYRSREDSDELGHMLSLTKPSLLVDTLTLYTMIKPFDAFEILSAKTRSDRDKLCHFWSKMKSQESQNKLFLFIASYLVYLILEGFC